MTIMVAAVAGTGAAVRVCVLAGGGAIIKAGRLSLAQCVGKARCGRTSASVTKLNMGINKYSSKLTQNKSQGASQAMLYATGLKEEDLDKAQIGISSVWYEGNPCNMHLMDLAAEVKRGVQDAGMVGYRFNTIGVSDGISMGTDGMSFSLQSRDLIADSIETVMALLRERELLDELLTCVTSC
jgi:dihydroxyacid dehydratase/phosphogluconate dehydratase